MNDKVQIACLATGVPGLDALLGGGLGEFSFTLIAGPPGAGKTTLAHQIMFARAGTHCKALYFTICGEPPLKMLRYQQQYAFFDIDKVDNCIRYINLGPGLDEGNFSAALARIETEVAASSPALVFVDAMPPSAMAGSARNFIGQLASRMTSWQATTFLIGETAAGAADAAPALALADAVLALSVDAGPRGEAPARTLRVLKLRGRAPLAGAHSCSISAQGMAVLPSPTRASTVMPDGATPVRLPQGQFLARLAHELRNPLAPISMAATLLARTPDASPELLRLQGVIERQLNQLTRLLDDLGEAARINAGGVSLQRTPLDLAILIGMPSIPGGRACWNAPSNSSSSWRPA